VNMETGVLRRMLKRARVWNAISEDTKALPERHGAVGKVLTANLKRKLFEVAASKPEWAAAHCAAVLAVSTTCRGVEIRPALAGRGSIRPRGNDSAKQNGCWTTDPSTER
jgi:hypothetical protein